MAELEIRVGDVVVLKSDDSTRHRMTVGTVDGDNATCFFWKDGSTPTSVSIPIVALKISH